MFGVYWPPKQVQYVLCNLIKQKLIFQIFSEISAFYRFPLTFRPHNAARAPHGIEPLRVGKASSKWAKL